MTNGRKIVLPACAPLSDVFHILDLACFCKKKLWYSNTVTECMVIPVLLNCHCKELSIKTYEKCFGSSIFAWSYDMHDQWPVASLAAWCTEFYCRQLPRIKSWIIHLIHAQVWFSDQMQGGPTWYAATLITTNFNWNPCRLTYKHLRQSVYSNGTRWLWLHVDWTVDWTVRIDCRTTARIRSPGIRTVTCY